MLRSVILLLVLMVSIPSLSFAYPIDGYLYTGIRRLLRLERIILGEIDEKMPPNGALLTTEQIKLNLYNADHGPMLDYPTPDPALQETLNGLFPNLNESYSVALLDVTPGRPIRYADRQPTRGFQPGSVGKLAVLAGLFCELENIYPFNFDARIALLKERVVRGGPFAVYDEHTVPFYELDGGKYYKRQVRESDEFSLFEWADHMVSVSNNGAASVLWREVLLMRVFQSEYPCLNETDVQEYLKNTPRKELMDLAIDVVSCPLVALGIDPEEWRLGLMFTRGASNIIPGQGGSIGSPKGLMKFLIALESGRVTDPRSSLEMKRLLYMTDRRIRYGTSEALDDAALYFKSGSLYSCDPNKRGPCGKYAGNRFNYMNSVAIVEQPEGAKYIVVLMSNVLSKNSNFDHRRLAGQIDAIVRQEQ
ncbi:serine hydrolase [Lewinella sp. LCG006]|uniref:serine hydrolase n=1 Tax=Lewinella sp. LCG006 TaxID=3231911 RepID=UPI0034616FB8